MLRSKVNMPVSSWSRLNASTLMPSKPLIRKSCYYKLHFTATSAMPAKGGDSILTKIGATELPMKGEFYRLGPIFAAKFIR